MDDCDGDGDGVEIDAVADDGNESGLLRLLDGVKFNTQFSVRKSNIKRF